MRNFTISIVLSVTCVYICVVYSFFKYHCKLSFILWVLEHCQTATATTASSHEELFVNYYRSLSSLKLYFTEWPHPVNKFLQIFKISQNSRIFTNFETTGLLLTKSVRYGLLQATFHLLIFQNLEKMTKVFVNC